MRSNTTSGRPRTLRDRLSALAAATGAVLLIAGTLTLVLSGPAEAATDDVCTGLDSGKINVSGNHTSITITAPAGALITEYCVKAGSENQEEGPVYVTVNPAKATVTFSHPTGKDISHYSYSWSTIVTPAALSFRDPTCEDTGVGVTLPPDTDQVTYTKSGSETPGGTVTVTATAASGFVFADGTTTKTTTHTFPTIASLECGTDATPVAPTVVQSEECEVDGSYTIPATAGVQYQLDGVNIAAGTYSGPETGTVTAVALAGHELTDPAFSFALNVAAAEECEDIAGVETETPAPVPDDGDDEVLGVETAVPTAVNAGIGADTQTGSSGTGLLVSGLLGGGLLMLLIAGWLKLARSDRGAHQA